MSLSPNQIFESSFDDELFNVLPTRISRFFGARSMIFHLVSKDGDHSISASSGYWPKEQLESYSNGFIEKDILWQARAEPKNIGRAWNIIDGLISREEFDKSEIVNEHYKKFDDDLTYAIGGIFNTTRGQMAIGVHRGKNAAPFSSLDVDALNNISPHIINMLMTRAEFSKIKDKNEALSKLVDDCNKPFVHADFSRRIINYNDVGIEKIIHQNGLQIREKKLFAINDFGQRIFETMSEFAACDQKSETVIKPSNKDNDFIKLQRFTPSGMSPQLILTLHDKPSNQEELIEYLQLKFDLTSGEAIVAILIAEGKTVDEVAQARNVSRNTIKSQLKEVYIKTETPKQSKLSALINSLL